MSWATSMVWFARLVAQQIEHDGDLLNLALTSKANYKELRSVLLSKVDCHFGTERRDGRPPRQRLLGSSKLAACVLEDARLVRSLRFSRASPVANRFDGLGDSPWDPEVAEEMGRLYESLDFLVNLRELVLEMDWRFFRAMIVVLIPSEVLCTLAFPVNHPIDLRFIGLKLPSFRLLKTLRITSLPCEECFISRMPLLAKGLAGLTSSLKELSIEIIGVNRPYSWAEDDFIPPSKPHVVYMELFPTLPVPPQHFSLTVLHLKHFDLPTEAFDPLVGRFDARSLRHLSLPRCTFGEGFWENLALGGANLISLTSIDYSVLLANGGDLVSFLTTQRQLEICEFVRDLPRRDVVAVDEGWLITQPSISPREPPMSSGVAVEGVTAFRQIALPGLPALKVVAFPAVFLGKGSGASKGGRLDGNNKTNGGGRQTSRGRGWRMGSATLPSSPACPVGGNRRDQTRKITANKRAFAKRKELRVIYSPATFDGVEAVASS
ncbi:MAG: hypothetical protein M1819_000965 [Sarea resinae]|nr:MAG: hypothetical protein M1819_000965 [Sarea resinae]